MPQESGGQQMQESVAFEEDVAAPKLYGTLKANIEWHEIVEKDL